MANELTQGEVVELLIRALPYPVQMEDIDLSRESDAVRFTWRGKRWRVCCQLGVEEACDGFLRGSAAAILMERLLQRERANDRLSLVGR